MLCLTRYVDESVIIDVGDVRIRIMLVHVRGNRQARLAIEAPKHVKVMREELLDRDRIGEAES